MFLFGTVGPQELLLVLLIVIIIFGARKLPDLGKSLGEGIKNFKSSVSGKDKNKDQERSEDKSKPDSKD
jgi:sec-independent protein translocase protein TatA